MLTYGSLFTGAGGLEMGVQSVLPGRTLWHSDIDPGACKVLAHRWPDVPNLGDITAIDWAAVPRVDVLTGGFPYKEGGRRLNPAFVEWMMGWPPGHVTAAPGVSDPQALRICGNGVVPQQAAAATRALLHDLTQESAA